MRDLGSVASDTGVVALDFGVSTLDDNRAGIVEGDSRGSSKRDVGSNIELLKDAREIMLAADGVLVSQTGPVLVVAADVEVGVFVELTSSKSFVIKGLGTPSENGSLPLGRKKDVSKLTSTGSGTGAE